MPTSQSRRPKADVLKPWRGSNAAFPTRSDIVSPSGQTSEDQHSATRQHLNAARFSAQLSGKASIESTPSQFHYGSALNGMETPPWNLLQNSVYESSGLFDR